MTHAVIIDAQRSALALSIPLIWLCAAGCRSQAEYAPHRSLRGVDQPYEQSPQPTEQTRAKAEEPSSTSIAIESLEDFADRVRAILPGQDVPLAVFPAMTPSGNTFQVSALGEERSEEVARLLAARGLTGVTHGARLKSELVQWNRGPGFLCDPSSAEGLAQWMEYPYAIVGTLSVLSEAFKESRTLALELHCVDILKGSELARQRVEYSSDDSPWILERSSAPGDWKLCSPAVDPSIDREIELVANKLARDFCHRYKTDLSPAGDVVRFRVLPTSLPLSAERSDRTLDFAKELHRQWREALLAADQGARNAGAGSVKILGKTYASFEEATSAYAEMRRGFENSGAGRLGALLAQRLATGFENNGVVPVELVPGENDLETILAWILIETAQADEGLVDPSTVAEVESKGSQVLLRSTVRTNLEGQYEIQLEVTRIGGKYWSKKLPLDLHPLFSSKLERALAREGEAR